MNAYSIPRHCATTTTPSSTSAGRPGASSARRSYLPAFLNIKLTVLSSFLAASLLLASVPFARAQDVGAASAASALSVAVPVALSITGGALLLSGAASVTVVAVQASAEGTVWTLERASDGARWVVSFAADTASTAATAVGTVVTVTTLSTGVLLSVAGEAIAFVANEVGASLIYNERVTR